MDHIRFNAIYILPCFFFIWNFSSDTRKHSSLTARAGAYFPPYLSESWYPPRPCIIDLSGEVDSELPNEHCDKCLKEHPAYSCCPFQPCRICYTHNHHPPHCPYEFDHIPRGVKFNDAYVIVCQRGHDDFDEDKWVCNDCGASRPVLKLKECYICESLGSHTAYECPKDKELAAEYRLTREKERSIPPIPYLSFGPTPRRGFLVRKDGKLMCYTEYASNELFASLDK